MASRRFTVPTATARTITLPVPGDPPGGNGQLRRHRHANRTPTQRITGRDSLGGVLLAWRGGGATSTSPPATSMAVGGSSSGNGRSAANSQNGPCGRPPALVVFRTAVPRRSIEKTAEVGMTP
ncbi:hypothetical protein NDU88_003597 [Pleurodeles waltl]|uniref:Uncharacterized protein n=1 Tax=Pleurodeles waltl TaxID=8319 RepID=A0AAV7WSV9_PLEWA|nr:hypothetical protein NDU88_003597 [Pleurodeles waltl]